MLPHEIHHIKAYVVFFLLSASLIGVLVYLYIPIPWTKGLKSETLIENTVLAPSPKAGETSSAGKEGEPDKTVTPSTGEIEASQRRIRLTKILIRYQKELQTLENQRSSGNKGLDTAAEEKIKDIREKITDVEKLITAIK